MPCISFPSPSDISNPFPDVNSLMASLNGPATIPSYVLYLNNLERPVFPIPMLPSIPSPITSLLPTVDIPSIESALIAAGIQIGSITFIIDMLVSALTQYIPEIPMPEIPGLPGFTLQDLLASNPQAMLETLKGTVGSLIPLYPSVSFPELAAIQEM